MTAFYHGSAFQDDLAEAIGNTPLIRLRRASEATGCTILGKAEFMNPGGSVKDRAGLAIIRDAEERGTLKATDAVRYYISSLDAGVKRFAHAVRNGAAGQAAGHD